MSVISKHNYFSFTDVSSVTQIIYYSVKPGFANSYISFLANQPTVHSGGANMGRVSDQRATPSSFNIGATIRTHQEMYWCPVCRIFFK